MAAVEIHVMQGRLLTPEPGRFQAFPPGRWRAELELAPAAGVDGIEWIYERYGEDRNPIASGEGLVELDALRRETGVKVESLCADWFMDRPLVEASGGVSAEAAARLERLLGRAQAAGIRRVVLPFVDASALRDDAMLAGAVAAVRAALPRLEETGVELHLETDLDPAGFAALLREVDHPFVRANYDTGNSASLGFDPREEFAAYGERIGSVHVKDRVLGGGTVPLGAGDARIDVVFELLHGLGWERPLVLQVARGPEGDEVATTAAQAELVRSLWARRRAAA